MDFECDWQCWKERVSRCGIKQRWFRRIMCVNGCISYMISLIADWTAKFGKAAMDFKAISLQSWIVWTNQVPEPGMGVLMDRGQRQWHTLKVYLSAGLRAAENVWEEIYGIAKRKTDLKIRKIADYLENLLAKYGHYWLNGWSIMMTYGIGGEFRLADLNVQLSDWRGVRKERFHGRFVWLKGSPGWPNPIEIMLYWPR